MGSTLQMLLNRLQERAHDPKWATDMGHVVAHIAGPPVAETALDSVEDRLGLHMPILLRAIYRRIGDGGFGPGYGLLPLAGSDETIEGTTQGLRLSDPGDPLWHWPHELLVVCHWGCAIYSCVDCADPVAPIVRFDPNGHESGCSWEDAFSAESASLGDWLEDWLSERPLEERFALVRQEDGR